MAELPPQKTQKRSRQKNRVNIIDLYEEKCPKARGVISFTTPSEQRMTAEEHSYLGEHLSLMVPALTHSKKQKIRHSSMREKSLVDEINKGTQSTSPRNPRLGRKKSYIAIRGRNRTIGSCFYHYFRQKEGGRGTGTVALTKNREEEVGEGRRS